MRLAGTVISLKKVLGEEEASATLMRVLQVILEGIGTHLVEGDPDERARFRSTLERASGLLAGPASASEFLMEAGAVVQAMEDYNRRTGTRLHRRCSELQIMLGMLTRTVESVAVESGDSVSRLRAIETQIEAATRIEDIRMLRLKLGDCLTGIQEETVRRREQARQTREALNRNAEQARAGGIPVPDPHEDSVTGLPDRVAAEAALGEVIRGQETCYVAAAVIDRIQSYNETFGNRVGDEVLRHFAEFLRGRVRPGCRLFRWSGPAILMLIQRPNRIETVREEVNTLLAHTFEHDVSTPNRSIHLPITSRWTLLPMMASPRLLTLRIDSFIAGRRGPEL